MGKYGAFAYSKSTAELGYSSEHDDPEAAKQEALVNCGEDDAVILCCECDRWLAFAQSASTGGYAWVDRENGPTAAADAVAACQKACGASDVSLVSCYSTNDGQEYTPPRYGAFAYSKSTAELGYSSEHDDPEAAKQEALVNCGEDDAVVLCCECDRWLAFAQSASTGGYAWVDREDGPTAAADAVAACQKACGASDVSLVSCYSTNDGQEYTPPKYGAFAYSKASGAWNWSSQHDDPEAAEQEALAKIDDDDAAILCCECDCWLAFAFSVDTGLVWGAGDDGPTAAADAVAACQEAGAADDARLLVCYSTNDGQEYTPPKYGAFAYSKASGAWNWSSQHDDPAAAEQEALAKIDEDDAAILCCECDCWLAFAFSVDTGFVSGAGDDGPTAAADAVAACQEAGAADDVRLLVCYSTNDGEEYLPQAAGKLAKVGKMATWLTGEVAKEGVNMLLSRLLKGG